MQTAEGALTEFRREIAVMAPDAIDLLAVERRVQELTSAMGRALMREVMARADATAPEITIDGEAWGNRRMARGTYTGLFGDIELERATYQRSGRGRVAVPLELRLGIVEGAYTPRVARILTKAVALMPEAEAEDLLAEVGVANVSKSTLHRVPRAIASRYESRREMVEKALRERDPIPERTVTIQVALDGVMVPQDGEHARARGRKTDDPDPPRHEQRYGHVGPEPPSSNDGTLGRAWHEAAVGTVAFFDADGVRLKTTYLARMPEPFKATLCAELEAEMRAVVAERPDINICFASDGAAPQWTALDAMRSRLPASWTGHPMTLVDAFHVAEYVQLAANAIEGEDTSAAKVLAATWRETLKEEADGVSRVVRAMRSRRTKASTRAQRKDLDCAIDYITRQHKLGRMNYPEAIARNYPIGTGVTEAAAKTVVAVRMKRAGARFSQHGGQTVMLFRAAFLSRRFDALHEELHATYTASIAA
ncbi:MAG: hypothetical protein ACREJ3_09580 [Polyangiaceae bacterium]